MPTTTIRYSNECLQFPREFNEGVAQTINKDLNLDASAQGFNEILVNKKDKEVIQTFMYKTFGLTGV